MMMITRLFLLVWTAATLSVSAFLPTRPTPKQAFKRDSFSRIVPSTTSCTSLRLALADAASFAVANEVMQYTANSLLLATIDSDIASISDNEFAPIFMGGIAVMFGGVLSTMVVGYILESKNLYASVVADSYAQGAQDEDFWKGLSEEEKVKAEEMLQKVKNSMEGTATPETPIPLGPSQMKATQAEANGVARPEESKAKETKVSMFSDYGE
jgi:hypothetical protein